MHDLDRGVLDRIGDDLGGDLLRDDQALAVGTDLCEQPGEHLHRVRRRSRSAAVLLRAAQQPVGFLEHRHMAQPGGGARTTAPGLHPQVLGQLDQHGPHQERLVAVVADVLDLEHDIAAHELPEVDRVAALEEPARGAQAQARDPDRDEPAHVVGDLAAVTDLGHDPLGRGLQIGQSWVPGADPGRDRLAQGQIPACLLVHPGHRGRQHLRERLVGGERREEQGPDQVGVGLQREAPAFGVGGRREGVDPGGDLVGVAGADPHDPAGRPVEPHAHQPVLGLGRLDGQPRDACAGRRLQQCPHGLGLARSRRPADEHVPVQRGCRQREAPGRDAVTVQHGAQRQRGHQPLLPRRWLRGDVEFRAQRQPHAGHLDLGHPGQRRQQRSTGVEGEHRRGIRPGWREHVGLGAEEFDDRFRCGNGRGEGVGKAGQVHGGAEQAGDACGGFGGGRAGQHVQLPEAGGQGLA